MEHFSEGERLRELGLVCLEKKKKRLQGDLIVAFQYLRRAYNQRLTSYTGR